MVKGRHSRGRHRGLGEEAVAPNCSPLDPPLNLLCNLSSEFLTKITDTRCGNVVKSSEITLVGILA